MAQHTQIDLIDDLTGEEARETVRFGVDGTDYAIDLTRKLEDPHGAERRAHG